MAIKNIKVLIKESFLVQLLLDVYLSYMSVHEPNDMQKILWFSIFSADSCIE